MHVPDCYLRYWQQQQQQHNRLHAGMVSCPALTPAAAPAAYLYLSACMQLRRAYLGAGYGSSSSSSSDYEDNDYVVPRGRLLEDYQRLALHTERHLNGRV